MGWGITLAGSQQTCINNLVGLDVTGAVALGNKAGGINIANVFYVLLERNYISGNLGDGLVLSGGSYARILNNWIGQPWGNFENGCNVADAR